MRKTNVCGLTNVEILLLKWCVLEVLLQTISRNSYNLWPFLGFQNWVNPSQNLKAHELVVCILEV
jgi:hypothetical protein